MPLAAKAAYNFDGGGLTAANNALGQVGSNANLTNASDLPTLIGTGISVFLGILGLFFLILVIWAGFQYINSKGDPAKTKTAIGMLTNAVIGMVIVIAAYAIANFVLGALSEVSGQTI
jgi:hypothetical protein